GNQDYNVLQGIENLSISKDEKSLTTSTQKDNAHNIYNDTIVDLGIRTSGTSQADESVNTSTQDDDSHNASNNTTISLGKLFEFQLPEKVMYSHARENTSNNAIVDLVELSIRTLGTSQADESINISTQDNDSHNANNYTIINLGVSSTRK
ncbi:17225_t:CDS:2, partial [Gigaspora rosea]